MTSGEETLTERVKILEAALRDEIRVRLEAEVQLSRERFAQQQYEEARSDLRVVASDFVILWWACGGADKDLPRHLSTTTKSAVMDRIDHFRARLSPVPIPVEPLSRDRLHLEIDAWKAALK